MTDTLVTSNVGNPLSKLKSGEWRPFIDRVRHSIIPALPDIAHSTHGPINFSGACKLRLNPIIMHRMFGCDEAEIVRFDVCYLEILLNRQSNRALQ